MIYRFDDFELDQDRYELRMRGAVQKIEPLVFDLLVYLARHPGRIVPRDDVIDAVWQGRSVSDATISSCIKSARKVLGDSGDSQHYIQTIRGRGFRLSADVVTSGSGDPESAAPSTGDPSPAVRAAQTGMERPVVAVLPFDNLSAESDRFFADGLTEDIITNLTRFRELHVIARTATFQFRKRDISPAAFCAELNASFFVEGSVRRAGNRVRITAQLIDAASGLHQWAESYDRDMEDIFAVQDEVTRTIAASLGVTVQDAALQRAMKKSPNELDAYECVLRARRYTSLLSAAEHAAARDLLEKAVALDPQNADAQALLANVYLAEHRFGSNPKEDPIGRALSHAQTATELDPQNAYARCWLAVVHFFRHENDRFEAEAERALALNPNDPEILADIGHFLAFMGEFDRGVALSTKARQLNPLHPGWYYFSLVRQQYAGRDYAGVVSTIERIGMTDFYWRHMLLAAAQGQLDDPAGAVSLARMREIRPDVSPRDELMRWNAAPEDLEHLMEGLTKAGWRSRTAAVPPRYAARSGQRSH